MAVIGTFGSFTAARLGIYASQSSLNVTGNNIANINTRGYTRQRADLVSLHSDGNIRYANSYNLNIGYGVLVDGISQLRDPFLDIRYRDENASVGAFEARLKGLQQLSAVLDEVGMGKGEFGIIEAQFNDFTKQLQNLLNRVGEPEYDTTVRSSAESLVRFFNDYADALTRVKDNQLKDLQADVGKVNTILEEIRALNVQIRDAGIYGDKALELRDQRNVLIDDLSSYMKVDVRYDEEKLDEFTSVERINITLADSGNPPIKLIQGIYGTQLSMPEMTAARNPDYDPSDPRCNRYISQESDPANGKIVYTNSEREALRDGNNDIIWNNAAGEAALQALGYTGQLDQQFEEKFGQYLQLDADGNIVGYTFNAEDATQINNAKEKADDNRLWMSFEPLVDEKGRFMRDQYGKEVTESVDLGDTALYGSLQSKRELLTEEGEFASEDDIKFDPNANIKRGIPYYQRALDALARKFADSFNQANTGTDVNGNPDYKPVFLGYKTETGPDGVERYKLNDDCELVDGTGYDQLIKDIAAEKNITEDEAKDYLQRTDVSDLSAELQNQVKAAQKDHLGKRDHGEEITGGGILFSVSGDSNDITDKDGKGITAANISISKDWSVGSVRILSSKNNNILDNSTANDNIFHMIELMSEKMNYTANDIKDIVPDAAEGDRTYFEGSFQQRLADINTILSTDQETTTIQYSSFERKALSLENQRQSVSGVDLNDEATSMMMFQKSYAAACQLMTTLDSMLDKLINGTIR